MNRTERADEMDIEASIDRHCVPNHGASELPDDTQVINGQRVRLAGMEVDGLEALRTRCFEAVTQSCVDIQLVTEEIEGRNG